MAKVPEKNSTAWSTVQPSLFQSALPVFFFLICGRVGTNVLSRVGIDFVRPQNLGDFELFFISLQMVLRRETNGLGT